MRINYMGILASLVCILLALPASAFAQKYDFDDGTKQGWTMKGAYDDVGGGPYSNNFVINNTKLVNYPSPDGTKGALMLFLSGGTGISGASGQYWIMEMHSPDLSGNSNWQTADGFTVRIAENMSVGSQLFANLWVTVYDNNQGIDRFFYSGTAQKVTYSSVFNSNTTWDSFSFDWSTISNFPSNYQIKEIHVSVWGELNGLYEGQMAIDEVTAIGGEGGTPSITVDVPNGGEQWNVGSTRYIRWHSNNFSGPVNIVVSYAGYGATLWEVIANDTPNDGSFEWIVTDRPSTTCVIKILDAADGDPYDVSDQTFEITGTGGGTPSITVDVPNGGENWNVGSPRYIVWHSNLFTGNVRIELSTDGGSSYSTIVTSTANTGSYYWAQVTDSPSTNCKIKVSDASDGDPWDVSDTVFEISSGGSTNTSTGSNIQVPLASDVQVTFENVTAEGNTTLDVKATGPAAPPEGLTVVPTESPVFYDINTTAQFTGQIEIAIGYDAAVLSPEQIANLSMQVFDELGGGWLGITTSVDVSSSVVLGITQHLSTFAVMTSGLMESITILQPNGSEDWPVESEQEITWTSSNFSGPVRIEYSVDGNASHLDIVNSTENDGSYLWTVPNTPSDLCVIIISDANDGTPFDISDGVFSIGEESPHTGGLVVTNTDDSGPGSLRDAITQANNHAGADTILFNIPENVPGYNADTGIWTITPQSQLPAISDGGLWVDGFSQKAYMGMEAHTPGPVIQLDGSQTGEYEKGLLVRYVNVVEIVGLTINNFNSAGIMMMGVADARISGCYIGTDHTGSVAEGNEIGIWLTEGCIGVGIAPVDTLFNVISGNSNAGIFISDSSHHCFVAGNIIGLAKDRLSPLGNGSQGIMVQDQADSNEVFDNQIGANQYGVYITRSSGNTVANNMIGADHSWEMDFGNSKAGVLIENGAHDNKIMHNVIGFNDLGGVSVRGEQAVRNTLTHNWISQNAQYGIRLDNGGNMELAAPQIDNIMGGQIHGTALTNMIVEVFADAVDQGVFFVGSGVSSELDGSFVIALPEEMPSLPYLVATATDSAGNTSAFGQSFVITDVAKIQSAPEAFALHQNYPNPFNPETAINYTLPKQSHVTLRIFNLLGEEVITLLDENKSAGTFSIKWNGIDKHGGQVASGVYIYKINAGDFVDVKKMSLLR